MKKLALSLGLILSINGLVGCGGGPDIGPTPNTSTIAPPPPGEPPAKANKIVPAKGPTAPAPP